MCCLLIAAASWTAPADAEANTTLFSENFDGLVLGPNVDETLANAQAWTGTPPAGWMVDDSGVPFMADSTRGVTEWEGWSFANKDWWVSAAGDQQRGEFALGQGTVAVADPDEWDDKGNPINGTPFAGYYNALFKTPAISLAGAASGTVKLTFSSSWRDECCDDGPRRKRTTKRPGSVFPITTAPVSAKCSAGNQIRPAHSSRTMPPMRPWW